LRIIGNKEASMAQTPVEVRKTTPARVPDVWQSFRSEMDRLFDRFAGGFGMPAFRQMLDFERPRWPESSFSFPTPAVDVTEDDKAYKITAELPGLEEKNIDVTVSGDMLTLKGEKRYEKDEEDKNRHMSERAYGSFQRSFALPGSVDRDKIAANLEKGVLMITLPKTAETQKQQKKIEVKSAT
jgi:HSP20 family protein